MDLSLASRFHFPTAQRQVTGGSRRKLNHPPAPTRTHSTAFIPVTNGMTATMTATAQDKKHHLLKVIQDTQRGLVTNADQRSSIEEALVSLETSSSGASIDLEQLNGTWRLQYTSAPDVLILLHSAARFPFFQVGQIFQKFDCRDKSNGGFIYNVVKWSFPAFLEEGNGATLVVSAKFFVLSARNIYLQFEQIRFQDIYINDSLQSLIAPAVLPRSFLSLQILQFIRSFRAQFPVQDRGRLDAVVLSNGKQMLLEWEGRNGTCRERVMNVKDPSCYCNQQKGLQSEDCIICPIWMARCCWGELSEVEVLLFSPELSLFSFKHKGFGISAVVH